MKLIDFSDATIERFQAVLSELDPYGVFANDHLRRLGFTWPKEGQEKPPIRP